MLAFLPGAADIERAGAAVEEARLPLIVHRLHGQIDPAVRRRALVRDPEGRRKLILATSIAETSLTIDGVQIVIDAGLSRRPRFDKTAGIARPDTEYRTSGVWGHVMTVPVELGGGRYHNKY